MAEPSSPSADKRSPKQRANDSLTSPHITESAKRHLRKRRRKEARFRLYGQAAVFFALTSLFWLLSSLVLTGLSAFHHHVMVLDVRLSPQILSGAPDAGSSGSERVINDKSIRALDYRAVVKQAVLQTQPDVLGDQNQRRLYQLVSDSGAANLLRQKVFETPELIGQVVRVSVPVSDHVDQLLKGHIDRDTPEARRKISDQQVLWIDDLRQRGLIQSRFNGLLFIHPDSRDPELAGVASAVIGSVFIILSAFLLALPIGVGAALYLDEFAPRNRWTDYIEISINNLAAVPSIVFGLLGLAIFINIFGLQRSIPLVAGMVLALRAFPTIVIATRSALQSVSPSIVDGALSLGASHTQAVFQQKMPLATPGILTGSIIAMAQVLGETAPLLMIGMVAFVTDIPASVNDPSTALPVQIFLWSESAERAWTERAAAAILLLLSILVLMNGFAVWLRNRLEKRI